MERLVLEEDGIVGDNLVASKDYNGHVCIECEEPWAGDSECGFGHKAAVTLTKEQAVKLANWLLSAVGMDYLPPMEPTNAK